MADLNIDDLLAPPQATPQQPAQAQTVVASNGVDMTDLLAPPTQPAVSKTGLTQEPTPGWSKALQGYAGYTTSGNLNKSWAGWGLGTGQHETFEQARKRVETRDALQAQMDVEDFRNTYGYQDIAGVKVGATDLAGGWFAEQLPTLGNTATGALYGASIGVVFGGPAGLVAGAKIGAGVFSGVQMGGDMIYDLMEKGVDRNTAVLAGVLYGTLGGTLEVVGLGAMGKGVSKIIDLAARKAVATRIAGELAKATGAEVTTEGVESIISSALKLELTKDKERPFTMNDAVTDFKESIIKAAVVAGEMGGAGTAGGIATGNLARRIQEEIDAKQLEVALLQSQATATVSGKVVTPGVAGNALEAKQSSAKRALRKYLEGTEEASVTEARDQVRQAQDKLDNATSSVDRALARAELDQAKANLKATQFAARVGLLEEALTDKDLRGTVAERRKEVEAQAEGIQKSLDLAVQEAKNAATDQERDTWQRMIEMREQQLKDAKADLDQLNQLENLSEQDLQDRLKDAKDKLQSKSYDLQKHLAKSALNSKMLKRQRSIEKLVKEIGTGLDSFDGEQSPTGPQRSLQRLQEQQEFDKVTVQLIDDGLITLDELERLASRSPRVPIARLDALINMATNKVEQAAKLGKNQQRTQARAIRKLIDGVIDATMLQKADKDALKARARKLDTFEKLEKELPKLVADLRATFEERRQQAALKDVTRLAKSIKIKKREKSRYPGSEELLGTLKDFIETRGLAQAEAERVGNKAMAGEALNFADLAVQQLAGLFPSELKDLNAAQLEEIVNTIVELKETGRAAALQRILDAQAKAQAAVTTVWDRLTTKKGKQLAEYEVQAWWQKLKAGFLEAPWKTWEGLMQLISRRGTMSAMLDVFDLKQANSEYWEMREHWQDRWVDLRRKSGVDDKTFAKRRIEWEGRGAEIVFARPDENQQVEYLQLVSLDGEVSAIPVNKVPSKNVQNLTVWEMIQVRNYLLDQDTDAISRLYGGNKFSYPGHALAGESTLEQIEQALPQDAIKVADAMRQWYREFAIVVDDVTFRRFGRHLPVNETYGGPLLSGMEPADRFTESFRRMSTLPGSAKSRQGGSAAVEIRNAFDVMNDHLHKFAREKAYYEFEVTAGAVFSDERIVDFIERNYGKNTRVVIDQFIKDLIKGHYHSYSAASDVFGFFRRNAFSLYLGLKTAQYAKQLSGFVYGMQTVGPKAMIEGYAYFLANPQESIALMNKSSVLKARGQLMDPDYKGGGVPAHLLGTVLVTMVKNGMPLARAVRMIEDQRDASLLKSLTTGDRHGVYLSSFPVLLKVLKETGDEEAALAAFERAFETTQSSGSLEEMPPLFRGSVIERSLAMFTQQPTKQVELINAAHQELLNEPSVKNGVQLARTVAIAWLGTALYNLIGALFFFPFMDDDDRETALLTALAASALGPYGGLAFYGAMLTHVSLSMIELVFDVKLNVWTPKFLMDKTQETLAKEARKVAKISGDIAQGDVDGETMWLLVSSVADFLGPLTGIPKPDILKVWERRVSK